MAAVCRPTALGRPRAGRPKLKRHRYLVACVGPVRLVYRSCAPILFSVTRKHSGMGAPLQCPISASFSLRSKRQSKAMACTRFVTFYPLDPPGSVRTRCYEGPCPRGQERGDRRPCRKSGCMQLLVLLRCSVCRINRMKEKLQTRQIRV